MRKALLMVIVAAAAARAPAADAKRARLWDPETVATIAGTVEAVERIEMGEAWRCVRLRLRTAEGTLVVRVGPDWWVSAQKLAFSPGDALRVKGSRLEFSGEPTVVAGEIERGASRIVLRDASGRPAWDGK